MIRRLLRWALCSHHIHRPRWAVELYDRGDHYAFGHCRWCEVRMRREGPR